MSIVARWFGDGLTDGAAVSTSTAGTGDDVFDLVSSGAFTIDASGPRSPRIQMDQAPSTVAQLIWTTTTLGSLTNHAVRAYVELTANPSAGAPLITGYGSGDSAQKWRLDVKADGTLRLRNASNTEVQSSATALPLNTPVRIEAVFAGTAATVHAYTGESTTALFTLSGAVGSGVDAVRFGNPQTAPQWPRLFLDDLAVADTAVEIGPRGRAASAAWTAALDLAATGHALTHPRIVFSGGLTWTAEPHVGRRAEAGWAGGVSWTATPRTRRHATAAWSITGKLTVDTGDPPIYIQSSGSWMPATIWQQISGTWEV